MHYFFSYVLVSFFLNSAMMHTVHAMYYDEMDEICYKKTASKIFVWNEKTVLQESAPPLWADHDRAIEAVSRYKNLILTNDEKRQLLLFAVEHSNEKLCETLLTYFPDINLNQPFQDLKSAIRPTLLSRVQTVPIAQLLIKKGADVTTDRSVLCATVLAARSYDLVDFYCQQGAPLVRSDGNTIFHVLAWAHCGNPPKPVDEMARAICNTISDEKFRELMATQRDGVHGKGDVPLVLLERMDVMKLPVTHPRRCLYDFLRGKMARACAPEEKTNNQAG